MRSSWGGPQPNLVGYPLRQSRCQSPNRSLQHASNKCPQSPRISHIWVSPGHRGPVRTSKNALKATTRPALPASIFLAISKTLHPTSPYVHLHLLSRTGSSMSQSCPSEPSPSPSSLRTIPSLLSQLCSQPEETKDTLRPAAFFTISPPAASSAAHTLPSYASASHPCPASLTGHPSAARKHASTLRRLSQRLHPS